MNEQNEGNIIEYPAKEFHVQYDKEPIDWKDAQEEILPQGESVETHELVGHELTLLRAKRQKSSYEGTNYFYWCVLMDMTDEKLVNTSFGGTAIVEAIDAIIEEGFGNPIRFTLGFKEQGSFDGYYVME